jgi:hypothetical protein
LVALGRFGEAAVQLGEASRAAQADGKASNFMTAEIALARAAVAMAQREWGDSQQAIDAATSASSGETRRMRHQHARILILGSRLSAARGDLPGALANAAAARRIAESDDLRGDVFLWSDVMLTEGEARCLQAPSEDAARSIDQAMTTRLSIQRANSPLIADAQIQMARCSLRLARIDRAKDLIAQAEQIIGADHSLGPQFAADLQIVKRDLR